MEIDMTRKEYAHLLKPLMVRDGPAGLYPEPRIWAEGGRDWQAFDGSFSFGFFTEPTVCHPIEGAVVHPYDEVLVFAGTETTNARHLGGEVSIEFGVEREEYVFTDPTVVVVPKGTVHGPATIRHVYDKPIAHFMMGLAPEYEAEVILSSSRSPHTSSGRNYAHLIKPLKSTHEPGKRSGGGCAGSVPNSFGAPTHPKTGLPFESPIDHEGVMHDRWHLGPGSADHIIQIFGSDIEGLDLNFTWGFWSGCGVWHRGQEGHVHPSEQALIFVGLDPDNLNRLGAEVEIAVGKSLERNLITAPLACVLPAGLAHLPLVTRWVDSVYSLIVFDRVCIHAAPRIDSGDR
jgi:hypothetical protein